MTPGHPRSRSIALYLPNWIGDVVMATPAIQTVRNHFPDHRLIAVCKPYVADVLSGSSWFDRILHFDPRGKSEQRFWSVLRQLRSESIDTSMLFTNSFRTALLARLGGSTRIVGFARYMRDALLTHRLYPLRDRYGKPKPTPVVQDYLRIVQRVGIKPDSDRLSLFTSSLDEAVTSSEWKKLGLVQYSRVIGLNPGGAFGAAKHWPLSHFVELARRLTKEPGTGVLVLCGPSEQEFARKIVSEAGLPSIRSLAESPLSIGLTKGVVRRLSLLVTTDSGPRHFAAAFNVPVLTLYGPTHIEWTETNFPKSIHLQLRLECGPCQQRVCPLGHHRCMEDLDVDTVYRHAMKLLRTFTEESRQGQLHAS